MQPRLLFVIDNLNTGGAQRQMVNLAIGLKRRQYRVELFCYAPGDLLAGPLHEADIPVHWMLKRSRFSLDVVLALKKLIQTQQYDLALSFLTTPNFYLTLAGRLLNQRRMPIVISERFCDLPQEITTTDRFARLFYRFADHVVVNSHHQRVRLAQKYPFLKDRLSTIYNGYDLELFSPAPREPQNQRLEITTIASVSPYKNGLCLIEALRLLRERYGLAPEVDWIGQRVMQGERFRYAQQMDQQIHSYGLENQWRWLNQRSDIVEQLHQHDVLVHPSYGEGLPNVVCEALACARPVIVSDVLDHAKLVQDGISGYLFNAQDPADLAEKLCKFNSLPPEARRQMGLAGRRFAEANLSLGRFVQDYEQLFLHLLS
jgi:glycosyltransferase involved in cell wall biosynthesis